MPTYGTTDIPSDIIDVVSGGTVSISAAFDSSVVLIGGMDTATGSASTGSVVEVQSPSDAQSKFGDGSELHTQVSLAYDNDVSTVYALPVSETTVTGETQSTATGSLSNAPIFDPNIHSEHSVSVTDSGGGSLTVNIVYDEGGNLSQPADADTINVNPVTSEYAADAAPDGSDYQFDYDYGDYSSAELQKAVNQSARIVGLLNENETVVTDLATELGNAATNSFDFQHGFAGAAPLLGGSTAANYTDGLDDQRISVIYPPRGTDNAAEDNHVRTIGAVAGYQAQLSLGVSATNDALSGLTSLRSHSGYDFADAGDLTDVQVLPLWDYPPVTIVKDMTTSTTQKFERVYAVEVADEVAELSHQINRNFIGGQNTASTRAQLRRSHRNTLQGLIDDSPPKLNEFTLSVKQDTSNDNEVDVEIGVDIVGVMDIIDVTITVGDIIQGPNFS